MCRVRARITIKLIAMVGCIVRSLKRDITTALVTITGIIITIVIAALRDLLFAALRDLLFAVLRDHLTDTTAIATGMVIATRITMVITAIARNHPIASTGPAMDITQDIIARARDHLIGTTAPATPKAMGTLSITIVAAIIGITQEIATMVITTPKATVIIIAENMDTMSTGNTVPATDTITALAGSSTRALLIDTIATTMIIAMVTATTKITARATITADMATTRRDPSITAVTAMGIIAGSMGTIITEKAPKAMAITRAMAIEKQDPSIRANRGDTIAIDTITIRRDQSIMDMDTDTRNTIAIRKDLSITDMDMDTDTRNIITTRREQSIIPAVTRNITPQSNSIRVHSFQT